MLSALCGNCVSKNESAGKEEERGIWGAVYIPDVVVVVAVVP